jgi:chromosome segregation ATPase
LLLALLFGRDTCSYITTSLGSVRQAVRDQIPVEMEITRARDMVKNLDPEIQQNMHLIAREEVGLKNLKDEIAKSEKQMAKYKNEIERLTTDLGRKDSIYTYNGVTYTSKQVENDLTRRFELFKDREGNLDKLKEIVGARQERLAAANEKLRAMRSAKEQLLVDIEHIEARNEMVKVAQTTSQLNFDDSRLARTKDLIRNIGTRIDVAEKLVTSNHSGGHIALDEPENSDITERVTEYFNKANQESPTVVKLD